MLLWCGHIPWILDVFGGNRLAVITRKPRTNHTWLWKMIKPFVCMLFRARDGEHFGGEMPWSIYLASRRDFWVRATYSHQFHEGSKPVHGCLLLQCYQWRLGNLDSKQIELFWHLAQADWLLGDLHPAVLTSGLVNEEHSAASLGHSRPATPDCTPYNFSTFDIVQSLRSHLDWGINLTTMPVTNKRIFMR